MDSFNKVRLAGIVSVISICGVLAIEIVGNVVGDYVTEQLKGWQAPALTSVTERPPETAGSVTLPVTPPTPSENLARASVGEPQAEPLPVQEAAPSTPPDDLVVPGQGNRAMNRAALKQRVNKWRAQRRRSNNRWNTPRYPRR